MPGKANQNKLDYIHDYNKKNYEQITMLLPLGVKAEWKQAAERVGTSITKMLIRAVEMLTEKNKKIIQKKLKKGVDKQYTT